MTTVIDHTTEAPEFKDHDQDQDQEQEQEQEQDQEQDDAATFGTEMVTLPPIIGEIVAGPIRLHTDEQRLPFRAGILDARYLLVPQRFRRQQFGDLSDLVASVRLFGVLAPLVVRSLGTLAPMRGVGTGDQQLASVEQFEIIDGSRRQVAAIEAGRFDVPCFIAETDDDISLILHMLELNANHKDLEHLEEAQAFQLLLDLGLSDQQIADARRTTVEQVHTAVKARALPAPAQNALNRGTLTLEQAHALEEFADAPDDQRKLLDKLGDDYDFKHVLAQLRDKRAYARNKELAKAHLVLANVDVTAKPRGFGYDSPAVVAGELVDADGQPVDLDTVKTQPGFHAFVEKDGGQARTVVYCDDPATHGFTRRVPAPASHHGLSPEQIAAKELAEQHATERREQLTLAATVRHEFIVNTFGTAKGARTLFVAALRHAALGHGLHRNTDMDQLYRALGGCDNDTLVAAGEDRLRRSLVAKYICKQEYNLRATTQTHRYHLDKSATVAWYDELVQRNYPLTDQEQELYHSCAATDENPDDEDDDEDVAVVPTDGPPAPPVSDPADRSDDPQAGADDLIVAELLAQQHRNDVDNSE